MQKTIILTILITQFTIQTKIISSKPQKKKGITSAGFELECSIPSGPYPEGSQILLQTSNWEIHPDTPTKSCDCENPRCLNLEFATIGGLSKKLFKESIKDAGYLFNNFAVYGFDQYFVKGSDFRFSSRNGNSLIKERESLYYGKNGFIEVLNGFSTNDAPHLHPGLDGTFGCKPQVTVSLYKDFGYEFFLKAASLGQNLKNKVFMKVLRGEFKSNLDSNNYLLFLNDFMKSTKGNNIFSKGDESAKSIAFLVSYYFSLIFGNINFERQSLELKYSLSIMSRIPFSDMYDGLTEKSQNQVCSFILNLCSNVDQTTIKSAINNNTQCDLISETNLQKCDEFRLINYLNEESKIVHPENEDQRLKFSEWLISIVKEDFRLPLIKLKEEDDSVILPKTDLLSPPRGLRVMSVGEVEEENEYRYGMGKYILEDKKQILVELRSLDKITDMGSGDENYRIEMNKTFRFMFGEDEEDIWANERDKVQNNIEISSVDELII